MQYNNNIHYKAQHNIVQSLYDAHVFKILGTLQGVNAVDVTPIAIH